MLDHLCFLAGNGRWPMLAGCLQDLARPLLEKKAEDDLSTVLVRLKDLLRERPALLDLLELRLAAECLLAPTRGSPPVAAVPEVDGCLRRWLPLAAVAPGVVGRWISVPVVLVENGRGAAVRYFIAGRLPGDCAVPLLSPWAEVLCDSSARVAILRAARLSQEPEAVFHLFPLLAPKPGVAICGPSLGLPLAIGLRQLSAGEAFPAGVAATGELTEDGGLVPVNGLSAKCAAAARQRFKHMVYPAAAPDPEVDPDLELHPAADLNEAMVKALLAGKGWRGPNRVFARMLDDADAFVAHCATVPAQWIDWAGGTGRLDAIVARIGRDAERLTDLARRMERLIDTGRHREAAAIGALLPPATVAAFPEAMLESGFRWAVDCLTLANRCGRVTEAAEWDRVAASLVQRAVDAGQPDAMAHYMNIAFVHQEQGRYRFRPDLPETLVTLETCLSQLAEIRRAMGVMVDKGYGALCGTLAQHYGFCGPHWLETTDDYIARARRAFGAGAVANRRNDWLRPLNYRCYARLDAGDMAGAQADLMAYLETESREEIWQKIAALDRWQHALLARFLADAGPAEALRHYLDRAAGMIQAAPQVHPWQLWANNLGRMAWRIKDAGAAERYFRCALERCRQGGMGPTVQVMALQPLAGLHALGRLEGEEVENEISSVRQAAAHLDPEHFRPVFEMDPNSLLTLVQDNPRRLFPFSYR